MSVSGNTKSPEYRKLTLLYEFEKLKAWTKRNITPTDIDGRFLIHSGRKYNGNAGDFFLWLDLRTTGKTGSKPQQDAFDALLTRGRGNDIMVVAEHPLVKQIAVPDDLVRYAVRMFDIQSKNIAQTKWFSNTKDNQVGWWVKQWFLHCENKCNHFITAFRQAANIYPMSNRSTWSLELDL